LCPRSHNQVTRRTLLYTTRFLRKELERQGIASVCSRCADGRWEAASIFKKIARSRRNQFRSADAFQRVRIRTLPSSANTCDFPCVSLGAVARIGILAALIRIFAMPGYGSLNATPCWPNAEFYDIAAQHYLPDCLPACSVCISRLTRSTSRKPRSRLAPRILRMSSAR